MKKSILLGNIFMLFILLTSCNNQNKQTEQTQAMLAEGNNSDCEQCAIALKKDVLKFSQTIEQTISEVTNLTEYEYNELKRDANIGATIPLVDFLISGTASYSEYKQKVSYYQLNRNYWSNYSQTTNYESYVTNPIAYQYWSECIKNNCGNSNGFRAFISESNSEFFMVTCGYKGDADAIKITFECSNGDIYVNNKKKGPTYTFNLKSTTWDAVKIVRTNKLQPTTAIAKTNKNYQPINLKSTYVEPKNPIKTSQFIYKDQPVAKGGQVAAVSFSQQQLNPNKSYEIIIDLPFYKNHQRECNSWHPNKHSYVAQFALYVNDKKVNLMPNTELLTVSVATDNMHETTYLRANLKLSNDEKLNTKSETFSAKDGINIRLVQEGQYYSACEYNHNEGMVFTAGGFVLVKEIE